MSKNEIPEGFTRGMAVMDLLPVLFFSLSAAVLASRLGDPVFLVGAVLVTAAGLLKAGWKVLIAFAKRNIPLLSRQMRVLMPAGFCLMLAGLVTGRAGWSAAGVGNHILSFPAVLFFLAGICGMICMIFFARRRDRLDPRANWTEQAVNAAAQLCILIGILL